MARVAVSYLSTSKENYKQFLKRNPTIDISFVKWKEILYAFNYGFRDYILETGDKVKMPWGMGYFSISKRKVKKFRKFEGKEYINLPIDWQKTKAAGRYIYNFNSHTDGYRCKWYWFRKDARFYQSEVWIFKPSRLSSRTLAQFIKDTANKYIEKYKEWTKLWYNK